MVARIGVTWRKVSFAIAMGGVLAGCDTSGSSTGPPPAAAPTETVTVELLLPASGIAELDVWEQSARRHEVVARSFLEVVRMQPQDPTSTQADHVREAVSKGVSALLVVAANPTELAPALTEARDSGMPIVVLDREVPVNGKPLPTLTYEPESQSAHELVAVALAKAKELGFPPEGPAVLLGLEGGDDHAKARLREMREALTEAGVHVLPDVIFPQEKTDVSISTTYLLHPELAIVLADEDNGLRGAAFYRHNKLDHSQRRFVIGGYCTDPLTLDLAKTNVAAGVVDRNIVGAITQAHDAAVKAGRGETIPDRIEVPTPLLRATAPEREGIAPPYLFIPKAMVNSLPGDSPDR